MAPFKNNRFGGGSRRPFDTNRGGGQRFGGRTFGDKELFSAECDSCRKECQVPFRPNGKKPVYCSDCFKRDEDREQRPRFERSDARPQRFAQPQQAAPDPRIDGLKRQLDTMQATLDKLAATVEASTRAAALTKEMRKYVPAEKPAVAPARRVIAKTAAKTPVKKAAAAKKPAPKKAAKAAKKA